MLAIVLTAVLVPQDEGTLAGRVLDGNGRPAANATVTLLHRPIPRHLDPAHEHRVVVATDERGAFRAKLRGDAVYSVWTATSAGASELAEGVSSGEFLELRIAPDSGPRTVAVAGLDAWPEAATFRWRALVGGEHLDFVPVERRDTKLMLPPLPPIGLQVLEVLRADGEVLHATSAIDDEDTSTVQVPPPATYTVRVTDATGAPLRDVEILVHLRNYWATTSSGVMWGDRFRSLWPSAGRTDANGTLTLRVADPGRNLWLLARKDGFRMSLDGIRDGKRFRAGVELPAEAQPDAGAPIAVSLEPAAVQVLGLRSTDKAPLAIDMVFVVSRVHVRLGSSGSGTPFPFALPVAGGEAVLPAPLPAGTDVEIVWTTLAAAPRAALKERLGHPLPAVWQLPEPAGVIAGTHSKLDADAWKSLQVIAADGRPAARIVVHLAERPGEPGLLVRTDRLGRAAVPVSRTLRASVYAREGAGTITIGADEASPVTLTLRALVPLCGRVTDGSGTPVEGARVTLRVTQLASGGFGVVENLALSSVLWKRSASDGTFELLAPPDAAEITVVATMPDRRSEMRSIGWDPAAPAKVEIGIGSK